MMVLVNTRVTYVWLLLAALTAVSWFLAEGSSAVSATSNASVSVGLLVLAFFKIRLVIMYFMEIQEAPALLRGLFEAWVLLVCLTLIFLYLFGGFQL